MTHGNISFRPNSEEDREFLKEAAKLAGAGKPSTLLRNIISAMRYMTPDEIRRLNTLAAEKEASPT